TDGGRTFGPFRGAPGGDDYHRIWISPDDPRVILIASDQGAVITVNGGETWSSWYNQPTAQLFHIITDNGFPYRVYGAQQESGSAGVLSRGNDGQITFREWHPVGVEEYGYVAPDPLHPNLVFGGKLTRFDWNTGQTRNVAPEAVRTGQYRFVRTMPVLFSPVDPRILYFAGNVLFKTVNGGESWAVISPDLTRDSLDASALLGPYAALDQERGRHRGVIYTIAPSFRRVNLIWVGTDDGLIHVTHDGGVRWRNVTPPDLTPWSKVSLMEASHFDTLAAYAAINRFRLDDLRPHIYRTWDGGATWTGIVAGIPQNEVVNVVREDPVQSGLLFAGTERSVYVSFDDGDHWQPLRLNLPPSSMRDLYIHEADLVVGTHGRSAWVLDDISPLRQMAEASGAAGAGRTHLFQPARATRVRWNQNTDTPLPIDEPAAPNPPDGAVLDYWLPAGVSGPVALEILDARGALVRRYASDDPVAPLDSSVNFPTWWIRPPQRLSPEPGAHRFVWDLHHATPPALSHSYPIAAIYRDTPREPVGPWALPGTYRVRLTAGGQTVEQSLTVRMDPRVTTPPAAWAQMFALSIRVVEAMRADSALLAEVQELRRASSAAAPGAAAPAAALPAP
ncbi:MAG: glycoside hydrolase, partial [Gemmatimonadota bacterium]